MDFELQGFRLVQDIKDGVRYPLRYLTQDYSGYWHSWDNIPVWTQTMCSLSKQWIANGPRIMVATSALIPDHDKIVVDLKE